MMVQIEEFCERSGVKLQEDREQMHMSVRCRSSFSGVQLQEDQEQMHV